MRTLANVLWHIPFLGFLQAFLVWLVGLIFTATLVGAPLGLGLMEKAKFLLAPATRMLVPTDQLPKKTNFVWKLWSAILALLYLPFGIVLAVFEIVASIGMILSIIGAPTGFYLLSNSIGSTLVPVGKKCVPRAVGEALRRREEHAVVEKYLGREERPVERESVGLNG